MKNLLIALSVIAIVSTSAFADEAKKPCNKDKAAACDKSKAACDKTKAAACDKSKAVAKTDCKSACSKTASKQAAVAQNRR